MLLGAGWDAWVLSRSDLLSMDLPPSVPCVQFRNEHLVVEDVQVPFTPISHGVWANILLSDESLDDIQ
jgi:hypothetical protein